MAEGRKLSREQVEALAQGRVYTGLQAIANGLVDEFGTLADVVRIAQQGTYLSRSLNRLFTEFLLVESNVRKVVEYPKKKTLWDMLKKKKGTYWSAGLFFCHSFFAARDFFIDTYHI